MMAGQPKRREPRLARTDFDSMTHEQLVAMLNSASSEGAAELARKLTKAASTITKIGDDLMTYVKGLEWQGEGGDAFRDWGGQSASATLRLGQYAEVSSRWMATVAQAIAEAKSAIPAASETTQAKTELAKAHKTLETVQDPAVRNDPDARRLAQTARSDAAAAEQRMEAARAEAVQQLRKLAQTYEYSAQQVNSVEPPTFSPPARHFEDISWHAREHVAVNSPGTSTASRPPSPYAVSQGTSPAGGDIRLIPHTAAPQPTRSTPVAMDIDGVATSPHPPVTSTTSPVPSGDARSPVQPPAQPGGIPPLFHGTVGDRGPVPQGRVPSTFRAPQLPGQGPTNVGMVRPPRETGITGGRPVMPGTGRMPNGIPQGTVIGGKDTQGRAPITRGLTPGIPGGASSGSANGSGLGRRLASEDGGVMGNRAVQPGRSPVRPFTPGGSGLVRPASVSGSPSASSSQDRTGMPGRPTPTGATPPRHGQQQGERPDSLVEDHQTWPRNDRRSLPPVVD